MFTDGELEPRVEVVDDVVRVRWQSAVEYHDHDEEEEETSKSMSIRLQPQEWFLENKITWVTMLAVLAAVQVRQINVIS